MVGFYKMPEEDTPETKEARGKEHYVMFEADECGEQLRLCLPKLNWLRLPNAVLLYNEFLLFVGYGVIASAEATEIEWGLAAPTINNITEVWGAITMHMHDWSRCNHGHALHADQEGRAPDERPPDPIPRARIVQG